MQDSGDLRGLIHKLCELFREDGLRAIRKGLIWLVMDFYNEAIAADGDSGPPEGNDFVALACAMARVHEDRQVTETLDRRHNAEVEGVARVVSEGAHTALAKNDLIIALAHNVFGGHKKFFERGCNAALEQNRFAFASGGLQ